MSINLYNKLCSSFSTHVKRPFQSDVAMLLAELNKYDINVIGTYMLDNGNSQ